MIAAVTTYFSRNVYPVGMALCAFTATIVQEYVRGIMARRKHNDEAVPVAMVQLMRRNGRRYGGYIVHLGIVFIGVAVLGNEFFQTTTNVTLSRRKCGHQRLFACLHGAGIEREGNHMRFGARLVVFDAETDKELSSVLPQRDIALTRIPICRPAKWACA